MYPSWEMPFCYTGFPIGSPLKINSMDNRELLIKVEKWFRENVGNIGIDDIDRVIEKSAQIVGKISGNEKFRKELEKARILLRMLQDYRSGEYRSVPWHTIAAIGLALLYILLPLDLIPDVLPIIGLTDDIAMFLLVWKMVGEDVKEYVKWRCGGETVDNDFRELASRIFGEEACL